MKTLRHGLLSLAMIATGTSVHAQFTATYTFGSTLTDIPTVANATFAPLTATNTTVSRLSGALASSANWVAGGSAADPAEFLSFSLSPDAGYELDLTSLTFKASSSSSGPLNVSVALYVGGIFQESSATFLPVITATATTAAMGSAHTFDFADHPDIGAGTSAQFRIYAWGGSSSTGTFRLDDISIHGSLQAVAIPEPSTYAVLLGAITLAGVALNRRPRAPSRQR